MMEKYKSVIITDPTLRDCDRVGLLLDTKEETATIRILYQDTVLFLAHDQYKVLDA